MPNPNVSLVDAMLESRNFYDSLNVKSREWMVTTFEQTGDFRKMRKEIKARSSLKPTLDDLKESVVMGYIDFGEGDRALELACGFCDQNPNANMHNLILRALLSSWRYTKQNFLEESLAWAKQYAQESDRTFLPYHNPRVRVGLVCDYGSTVFGTNALFPMCEGFARAGLDVVYYNFEQNQMWAENANFKLENIGTLSVSDLSRKIMQDRIDVLVDLNGRLRGSHRLGVFSSRSAPIQFNYFNLAGTSGIKNFDFVIADETQIPKEDEKYFSERVLRLPCGVNGAYSFDRDVPIELKATDPDQPFLFASFNAFFKYNTLMLQDWALILSKVPNAHLLIKCAEIESDRVVKKIADNFSRFGVDLSRIRVEGWSSLTRLRQQYSIVDLCLDTYPYSGGSSTLNALWQGVPVLTLCGEGWRARTSASMLKGSGLETMITLSREEYVEKAIYFATHRSELMEIKQHLAQHVGDNCYFQPQVVYRELAECFKGAVQRFSQQHAEA